MDSKLTKGTTLTQAKRHKCTGRNRNFTGTSFSLVHSFVKWDAKPLGCYVYASIHECIYSSVYASVRRMSEFMHNRLLVFTLAISFGDIRPEMCVQRWKGLLTTMLAGAINTHIYANWGAHSHRLSGCNRSHNGPRKTNNSSEEYVSIHPSTISVRVL